MIKPPSILQLEVTKNCNLWCIMCHKGQMPEGKDFVRTDISDVAINQVKPIYPCLKHAMLFGDGEPLVYPNFWQIVKDIRDASPECCIDFIQNGTMMYEKNCNLCLDYNINALGLSLGGATPESHNYIRKGSDLNKIISNFEMLRDMKKERRMYEPYIVAHIVVMRSNYKELAEFVEMCSMLEFWSVNLQQLFVTHPSMDEEVVSSREVEPYIARASEMARKLGIWFNHYPLESNRKYTGVCPTRFNEKDVYFRKRTDDVQNGGYCKQQQPWNTVYVLHDGKVVPDCHWWSSINETELNECGTLDENTDILDIWNGPVYNEIRRRIQSIDFLPQCRGCGLAGGVEEQYITDAVTHIDPYQEQKYVQVKMPDTNSQVIVSQTIAASEQKQNGSLADRIRELSETDSQKSIMEQILGSDKAL